MRLLLLLFLIISKHSSNAQFGGSKFSMTSIILDYKCSLQNLDTCQPNKECKVFMKCVKHAESVVGNCEVERNYYDE